MIQRALAFQFAALTLVLGCPGVRAATLAPGHVPAITRRLPPLGLLESNTPMHLAIGLALTHQKELNALIQRLYDPAAGEYRRFLTPREFAERFGPTEAQYQAAVAFALSHHLAIEAVHPNRMVLDVAGRAEDVSRAFGVRLVTYRDPHEERIFHAPDREPTAPDATGILDVSGLSDAWQPRPWIRARPRTGQSRAQPRTGSAANGSYLGGDFRAAYLPGIGLTGAGQSLGLLEFDGFYESDIEAYCKAAQMPEVPVTTILLDGFNGAPSTGKKNGNSEVSLDIELAAAMAPGLSSILVYEAGPNGSQNDMLNRMATDDRALQLSCSWGWGGGPSATTDQIFQEMAAQGQSFFCASGDSDAYAGGDLDNPAQQNAPSDSPYITVVGGTSLTTSGPGGGWKSETVWNWNNGTGTGGGISSHYPIPTWQAPVSMASNQGSTVYRNIPDVAMAADNICVYYNNGGSGVFGGTSCSAPLWAGLAALANQQGLGFGLPPLGFLNPALYKIGRSSGYAAAFRDVTSGNNTSANSPGQFYAAPGFDLCTGWGSPVGRTLIADLASVVDPLALSPAQGFSVTGLVGGPFAASSSVFTLSNSGPATVAWKLGLSVDWLTASADAGSLAPGAADTNLTVSLNNAATCLAPGSYEGLVWVTNIGTHVVQNRQCDLVVSAELAQNGGFETGSFSGWTLSGNTAYCSVVGSADYLHSGLRGAQLGPSGSPAYLSQMIPTAANRFYLLSFWWENPKGGSPNEFSVSWNGKIVADWMNGGAMTWSNAQFLVAGIDGDSTLQFSLRNDPGYFGLDDVSLTPLTAPAFQAVSKAAAAMQFSWNTSTGAVYQVQYTSTLAPPHWTNLGAPFLATNFNSSFSDSNAGAAPRFYRVVVEP